MLIGGVRGAQPARVVVIGGGVVGTHAARMAAGLGAKVTILDRSIPRLRELDELFEGRVRTRFSTIDAVEAEVFAADVIIGAVLVPGASAPKLLSCGMLSSMRKGSVIVDVAIDRADASRHRVRRRTLIQLTRWMASFITASPACPELPPLPRARH